MFSSQLPLRSKESVIDGLRQEQLAISRMSSATSTFRIKSPLNTPLETFALGQCVPSWTLRKSLRQRGIESNWLVEGTTLICARDVGHWTEDLHGLQQECQRCWLPLTRVSTLTYLLQISALQERVENPFGDLHPRPACLPGFCAAIYLWIAYHQAQTTTTSTGLSQTFARVHTRMNCKSPFNTPLETFALGQCVPSWTLRKSLRQRGIESNWLDILKEPLWFVLKMLDTERGSTWPPTRFEWSS